jgi:hypothetical protein
MVVSGQSVGEPQRYGERTAADLVPTSAVSTWEKAPDWFVRHHFWRVELTVCWAGSTVVDGASVSGLAGKQGSTFVGTTAPGDLP